MCRKWYSLVGADGCVKCCIVINCFFRQYITSHSFFMIESLPLHIRWDYWQLIAALKQRVEPLPLISHLNSLLSPCSLFFILWSLQSPGFLSVFIQHQTKALKKRLSFNRISMATDFQSYLSYHVTPGSSSQEELNMIWFRLWSWSHWSFNHHEIILYQLTSIFIIHLIWIV